MKLLKWAGGVPEVSELIVFYLTVNTTKFRVAGYDSVTMGRFTLNKSKLLCLVSELML